MSFSPDTDVLLIASRAGITAELKALGKLPLVVTERVWDESVKGKGGADVLQLLSAWTNGPTSWDPGSPEASTEAALLAQKDLQAGEISILAWAVHHKDVSPVLLERHAIFRAVEELPERPVLSIHAFIRVLMRIGLKKKHAEALSKRACEGQTWKGGVKGHPPLWW